MKNQKWVLVQELKIPIEDPVRMPCDNQGCYKYSKEPCLARLLKTCEDRLPSLEKDRRRNNLSNLSSTALQTAGILAKALPRNTHEELKSKLGLINIYNPA